MAHSLQATTQCLGRVVTYTAYNLGVGVAVGFARAALATYYLCKAHLYKAVIQNSDSSFRKGVGTRILDARIKVWKGEVLRGLIEIIPLLGSLFFTCMDNRMGGFNNKDFKISVYGLKEFGQLIKTEYDKDFKLRKRLGANRYNPLDLRLQSFFRT